MSYENPTTIGYRTNTAALSGGAAVFDKIAGPKGKTGYVNSIIGVVTTAVTVAAASILVGISGDTDKYASLVIPISSADAIANTVVRGVENILPADTLVQIGTDGAATAGAADVDVIIDWE